jgi:diguanylate cyclase (GGDEF)-like protein/PAS domain S-box-containing protein
LRDANGDITALLGITRDVTENKKHEQQQRIAATAFESQEGMMVTDADGSILKVNKAFTLITGYVPEEVIGKSPHILSSGHHNDLFYKAMWERINRTGEWEGEIWNRRKNGEAYPEYLTITAVKDSSRRITNYVATMMDITASKASEEEIRNLAFFDPLTRLPNRRLLQDRLQQALASKGRSGKEGAILFIDLDNFKSLNDTLGHDIGDMLLEQVAVRLTTCVREGDTVARIGGDEFVVMLEDLSANTMEAAEQTESVANKILATLGQYYQIRSHVHHSTPSIGATLFSNSKSIEELLKQADIAMYQAKKGGRNTLRFFDPRMQQSISARMALELELRNALKKQQFHLYYQIQLDNARQPLGAEALIRWIHPERGLVSPAEFIPMAEEIGLIFPIGWWVLETACAQIKAWQKNTHTCDLILSVNVSAKQFHQADFVDQVAAVVQQYGINPTLLKLELTESMLVENIEDTIATMNALNVIGVRISLDDFGTGYSSLQYLKRLPLDQLKIDQSFVRDIATDSSDKAIVTTIIAMARNLGLDVIAEGVETEEQRQFLENAGCLHYQGYLFGKPVPIELFEGLLRKN